MSSGSPSVKRPCGCKRRQEWLDKNAPTIGKVTMEINKVVTSFKPKRNIR